MSAHPHDKIGNRPFNRLDAGERPIYDSVDDLAFRGEYTGTDLIYKGFARTGAATSAAVWQIAKLTYDVSHNILSITWPENDQGNASNDYEFAWDSRAGYTYS